MNPLPHSPHVRPALAALLAISLMAGALGEDTVTLSNGDELVGSVFGLAPESVEIETADGVQKVSIVEIREIAFDGEPAEVADARRMLARSDARAAINTLATLSTTDLADEDRRIREEHAYLTLLAAVQSASSEEAKAASAALADFLDANPRSHHTYGGREALGNALAKQGRFEDAAAAYRALDRGPPALRVRSAAAQGSQLAEAGKPAEAIRLFEAAEAITTDPDDKASAAQKRGAALGLARCLAALGKAADGTAVAEKVIREADPEDEDLLAAAFAALGTCQRAAAAAEDALISFLTVDLVYNRLPEAHAEALYNLTQIWEASNNPERARAARQDLTSSYPDSPWTAKLAEATGPS